MSADSTGSAVCAWCGEAPHEMRHCPACQSTEETRRQLMVCRAAIKSALEDSESGEGWGPDITVCGRLRAALLLNDLKISDAEKMADSLPLRTEEQL